MKKKMLLFAALVAASGTAFISCSSSDEDVLAQEPVAPVAEETVVEEEGTPLKIKMVYDTRGTDWSGTNPLDKFTLFATSTGGTTRWSGALGDRGTSTTVSNGTLFENDGSGNFAPAATINWQDGTWDFYAVSDATFPQIEVNLENEEAEYLADASRHFYYTVPTAYSGTGAQTDLLVGAALEKTKSGGDVEIQFYHALAQIGAITFKFSDLGATDPTKGADNTAYTYIIKSATLCNVNSKGKYTFPAEWTSSTYNDGTWGDLSLPTEYEIDFPDFDKDEQGYYKIFELSGDDSTDPSSREATAFATGTNRGGTGVPNYFQCPDSRTANTTTPHTFSYTLPLAKKDATPFSIDADEKPTHPTFTQDGGLYVLPQSLTKTVWEKDASDYITDVQEGVYLKVKGIILNYNKESTNDYAYRFNDEFLGATGTNGMAYANNYYVTKVLNSYSDTQGTNVVGTYLIPLIKATKMMKAGHLYNLTFDLSAAVTLEGQEGVFEGAKIE